MPGNCLHFVSSAAQLKQFNSRILTQAVQAVRAVACLLHELSDLAPLGRGNPLPAGCVRKQQDIIFRCLRDQLYQIRCSGDPKLHMCFILSDECLAPRFCAIPD